MTNSVFLVINPSAKDRFPKRFAKLLHQLQSRNVSMSSKESQNADDATRICREALEAGFKRILPVGGDGTLSLCVQAFMKDGVNQFPGSAIIPLPFGTGNDFYAGIIAPRQSRDFSWITGNLTQTKVSLGQVITANTSNRYFINSFSTGITPNLITDYTESRARSYLISTLRTLIKYRPKPITVKIKGVLKSQPTLLFLVSKGAFVGGGMRLHQEADHRLGRAKIVWIPELSPWSIVRNLPRIYRGGVEMLPEVDCLDFTEFELELPDRRNWIEADGELYEVGKTIKVQLLPGCINILHTP